MRTLTQVIGLGPAMNTALGRTCARSAAPILLPEPDTGIKVNGHARASHVGRAPSSESGFTDPPL